MKTLTGERAITGESMRAVASITEAERDIHMQIFGAPAEKAL
jgi:hypothetical protein